MTSDVPVAAIVNEVVPGGTQSTSYNPVGAGGGVINLPLIEHSGADGWVTGIGVMNTGTTVTTVAAQFYEARTGAFLGGDMKSNLAPNAFWSVYQGSDLPAGASATAILSADRGGQVAVIGNVQAPGSFMSYEGQ